MKSKQGMLLAVAFIVPVFCCLIGIGAFILIATPTLTPEDIERERVIKEQESIAEGLKDRLAQVNDRLRQLHEELQKEEPRAELAKTIEEIMYHLESSVPNLQKELLILHQGLSEMQDGILKLEPVSSKADSFSCYKRKVQEMATRLTLEPNVHQFELVNPDRKPACWHRTG